MLFNSGFQRNYCFFFTDNTLITVKVKKFGNIRPYILYQKLVNEKIVEISIKSPDLSVFNY